MPRKRRKRPTRKEEESKEGGSEKLKVCPSSALPHGDEVRRMRTMLAECRGFDSALCTEAYLSDVMNQPSSKGNGQDKRSFQYTHQKMLNMCAYRHKMEFDRLCNDEKRLHDDSDLATLRRIVKEESYLYWYGFSKLGYPILWVRPILKDWSDRSQERLQADLQYHALVIDFGIRHILPQANHTKFMIVADCSGMGFRHAKISLMRTLITMLTVGYPDRMAEVVILPAPNWALRFFGVLQSFLPRRTASKVHAFGSTTDGIHHLAEFLDPSLLGTNLGGSANHACSHSLQLMLKDAEAKLTQIPIATAC